MQWLHSSMLSKLPFYLLLTTVAALILISVARLSTADYSSMPMIALWSVTAISGLTLIILRRLYRRPALMLLHLSLLVILAGALTTFIWGSSRQISLYPATSVAVDDLHVRLDSFYVDYYPGTSAPRDFVSVISVGGVGKTVSMNNVAEARGYRFFQSGCNPETGESTLTVTRDVAGNMVSYTGYGLLFLAMILCSIKRIRRFTLMLFLPLMAVEAAAVPAALPRDVADRFSNMLVYHNDRIAPMSTLARDFTVKVTGADSYEGLTDMQFLTGWLFFYDDWQAEPCIKVKGESRRLSLADFFDADGQYRFPGTGDDDANEKFALVSAAYTGTIWRIFPQTGRQGVTWLSPVDNVDPESSLENWQVIRTSFDYLAQLAGERNWTDFSAAVDKLKKFQHATLPGGLPSQTRIRAEQLFTAFSGSVIPAAIMIVAALILFFIRRAGRISLFVAVAALCWAMFLIGLNWYASGRVPMANGYETMQWMAVASLATGILLFKRSPLLLPPAIIVAGLAVMVAFIGRQTPQVSQLVPVLRSPLLSIHVLAVMIAYALLALMAVCSIAWLAGRHDMLGFARKALRPAVFILAAGIFIGAIWANQSWGRYWGWDPKEVWALITMLVYSIPLHGASLPAFSRDRVFALWCSTAFICVLVTYFGVNFFLGGMHSYS